MAYTLPDLPYAHDALEPHVDEQTMRIHHGKHHQGYVNKLNAAIEGHGEYQDLPVRELLEGLDDLPGDLQTAVRNNGGGHANHSLFWTVMSPDGGGEPTGKLADAINSAFGSYGAFREQFEKAAGSRFGSGWAWLASDKEGGLAVYSTPNQDSPYMQGHTPLLGLDVWEHAYYLNYQNRRPDYINAFFSVVDWDAVAENYDTATA